MPARHREDAGAEQALQKQREIVSRADTELAAQSARAERLKQELAETLSRAAALETDLKSEKVALRTGESELTRSRGLLERRLAPGGERPDPDRSGSGAR